MKIVVHFATIGPRFNSLFKIIDSWNNQSFPIQKIVMTTSLTDKRFTTIDELEKYKTGKVEVQTIEEDYGPNNKILGALKFYETVEDKENTYIIICDDDNYYNKNTSKSYAESIGENKNFIYTHFKTQTRLKFINHIQGADTYMLTPHFLNNVTCEGYKEYLDKTIIECPEAFYQDDYVISYYMHKYLGMKVKTVTTKYMYEQIIKTGQMHQDPKLHEREKKTKEYFLQEPRFPH